MATLEAETSVETSSFFVPPTFLKTESSRDKKKKKKNTKKTFVFVQGRLHDPSLTLESPKFTEESLF